MKKNDLRVEFVAAGIRERKLWINETAMKYRFSVGESGPSLYMTYKKKYPTFEEVIIPDEMTPQCPFCLK